MISNAEKLKALRYTLGLTQAQMAEKIGVSKASISLCENGVTTLDKVNASAQAKIRAFLEVQDIGYPAIAESRKFFGLEESQKSIQKHFSEGKSYRIYSRGNLGLHNRKNPSMGGSTWEYDCIFTFIRKEGKHHIFREIRGGWTRTYTDAQLVGKKIEEVQA